MDIRKIIREELGKTLLEGHKTVDKNYEFDPSQIWPKINELKSLGEKLDSNYSDNIANLQVLSTGERAGRKLAEIGYPTGDVVLFYRSAYGTSGKEQGGWFPIPGFINAAEYRFGVPQGWFIKANGVDDIYGIKTFQGTADYLKANEDSLDEIYMSMNMTSRPKPGAERKFPKEKEDGGTSLNLSVSDGPHEFPDEEELK